MAKVIGEFDKTQKVLDEVHSRPPKFGNDVSFLQGMAWIYHGLPKDDGDFTTETCLFSARIQ